MKTLRRIIILLFTVAAFLPLVAQRADANVIYSANYAGHIAPVPNGDIYTQIGCDFVVPVVWQNYHSTNEALSEWCGLGSPTGNIMQAGIYAAIINNQPVYNIFWEDYPYPQNELWTVHPGDDINVQINMNLNGPNTAAVSIGDATTNQHFYQPAVYAPFQDFSHAMFVMENPQLNHGSNWLPNFTTAWWSFNWYCGLQSCYNLTGGPPIGHQGNNLYILNSSCCAPPYANPSGIGANESWNIPSSQI